MKMILAILNNDDANTVIKELMKNGYQVTKLASTGGFLKTGTTTILSAVIDERVSGALEIIKTNSFAQSYSYAKIPQEAKNAIDVFRSEPPHQDIVVGGASVFVLNVEQFEKY